MQHGVALHTSLNSTGCCGPTVTQRRVAKGRQAGRRAGSLLLHLQDGTSRSAVLSTTDVAVLCRSIHARHRQALLVEHVPTMEDHHTEGLRCICWEDGRKARFTDILFIDQNAFHLGSVHFFQQGQRVSYEDFLAAFPK